MSRTRDTAAANERKDIISIISAINLRTPAGSRILSSFKEKFGVEISSARCRSGTDRGTHYDFEVEVNGMWKKVEHKGSIVYRLPTHEDAPWKYGVQFHNGGCEKYSLARKYARVWYTLYIESGKLREEFGINAPTPTFEEWFEKDCRVQGDPRTAFGKELKMKVRERHGAKASLLDKRADVLQAIEITDEDKATLMKEVLPVVNEVLSQKELWLAIYGKLDSEFNAVWYPQLMIDDIEDVIVEKKKDLEFRFLYSNKFQFYGILRWGKGAGFSCLRLDLK